MVAESAVAEFELPFSDDRQTIAANIAQVARDHGWTADVVFNDEVTIRNSDALIMLTVYGSKRVSITMVSVRPEGRNQRQGSAILAETISLADKLGLELSLFAIDCRDSDADQGLKTQSLIDWYGRYGFVVQDWHSMKRVARSMALVNE